MYMDMLIRVHEGRLISRTPRAASGSARAFPSPRRLWTPTAKARGRRHGPRRPGVRPRLGPPVPRPGTCTRCPPPVHMHRHICICVHVCKQVDVLQLCTCICMYTWRAFVAHRQGVLDMHAHAHIYMHAYTPTCIYAYMHICVARLDVHGQGLFRRGTCIQI